MGRKGVYTNEKRMWRLLLAGIVILSEVMAAGADVAYAKPAEMETDDNYAELTDMEEDFYAGFLEMYNAADTEQRGDETQEQELISPSEGEKKQYIVTLAVGLHKNRSQTRRHWAGRSKSSSCTDCLQPDYPAFS